MSEKLNEYNRLIWWILGLLVTISGFLIASKLYSIESELAKINEYQIQMMIFVSDINGKIALNEAKISRNVEDIKENKSAIKLNGLNN